MKKKFLLFAICILGIFVAGFEVWMVTHMMIGVVPVQVSGIIAMITAVVVYIRLCILFYQYWKEQKEHK